MKPDEIRALHKDAALAAFDEAMQTKLVPMIGEEVASQVQKTVSELRLERQMYGKDRTGLDAKSKILFADTVRSAVGFDVHEKANEALIEEQDNRGGYLVSREIADAIVRIGFCHDVSSAAFSSLTFFGT